MGHPELGRAPEQGIDGRLPEIPGRVGDPVRHAQLGRTEDQGGLSIAALVAYGQRSAQIRSQLSGVPLAASRVKVRPRTLSI
ncbi:hypothetical protein ACFOZ4_33160, partial [Hamadaea flava]